MDKEDTVDCHLAVKDHEIMPFVARWTNLEMAMQSAVSQKQISYDTAYKWNLKRMIQMSLYTNRSQPTDIENKLTVTKGKRETMNVWG